MWKIEMSAQNPQHGKNFQVDWTKGVLESAQAVSALYPHDQILVSYKGFTRAWLLAGGVFKDLPDISYYRTVVNREDVINAVIFKEYIDDGNPMHRDILDRKSISELAEMYADNIHTTPSPNIGRGLTKPYLFVG